MPDRGVEVVSPPAKRFDVAHAFKLRVRKGLSFAEIAKLMDTPESTVYGALKRFGAIVEDPDAVRTFRENEADILDAARMKIVSHMTSDEVISKASLNNAAFALDKVHNAARLIRNQSTSNVGVRTSVVLEAHGGAQAAATTEDSGTDTE